MLELGAMQLFYSVVDWLEKMDFSGLSNELLVQILIGVFIVFQLQRMIKKIDSFSSRLVELETEHKIISGSCIENIKQFNRRKTDQYQYYDGTD